MEKKEGFPRWAWLTLAGIVVGLIVACVATYVVIVRFGRVVY